MFHAPTLVYDILLACWSSMKAPVSPFSQVQFQPGRYRPLNITDHYLREEAKEEEEEKEETTFYNIE